MTPLPKKGTGMEQVLLKVGDVELKIRGSLKILCNDLWIPEFLLPFDAE